MGPLSVVALFKLMLTSLHVQHYNLVDSKELAPLQELIDQFQGKAAVQPPKAAV